MSFVFNLNVIILQEGQACMTEDGVITDEIHSNLVGGYDGAAKVGSGAVWPILIYNSPVSYYFLEHGDIVHQTRSSFFFF